MYIFSGLKKFIYYLMVRSLGSASPPSQIFTRLESRSGRVCDPLWMLQGGICSQAHSDGWHNSAPCGCINEVPIFLLDVDQVSFSARGHLHSLAHGLFSSIVNASSSRLSSSCFESLGFSPFISFVFCFWLEKVLCF